MILTSVSYSTVIQLQLQIYFAGTYNFQPSHLALLVAIFTVAEALINDYGCKEFGVCYICDVIGCDYVASLVHISTGNLLPPMLHKRVFATSKLMS